MKRRVSAFEEEQTKQGIENNEVAVNGTIQEEEEEKGEGGGEGADLTHSRDEEEEDEMVEQQQLVVTAPTHVCREEAEVCLPVCILICLSACLCPCLPVCLCPCLPVCSCLYESLSLFVLIHSSLRPHVPNVHRFNPFCPQQVLKEYTQFNSLCPPPPTASAKGAGSENARDQPLCLYPRSSEILTSSEIFTSSYTKTGQKNLCSRLPPILSFPCAQKNLSS